jgi:hypothetical protein
VYELYSKEFVVQIYVCFVFMLKGIRGDVEGKKERAEGEERKGGDE